MSKFVRWSGVVHTSLSSFYPKLKLGQARELLAAALGHNSYASLREHDLEALESAAKYVVLDHQRVLQRAASMSIPLTPDQWWAVQRELTPGRVSKGCYIGEARVMESAACHVFEDSSHPCFREIARKTGTQDGHWARDAKPLVEEGIPTDELAMLVRAEVQAFNEHVSLETPVIAEVRFKKVGRQLYGEGWLVHAAQHGDPRPYEPNDEGDVYGP